MAGPDRATASDARPRQPPRPLNAWILYRRAKLKELLQEDPELKRLPQSELSKKISRFWKEEPDIIRQQYEFEANVHKSEHQQNFPDYQFKPQKRSDKERDREERRVLKERERAEHRRMRSIAAPATRQPSVTPSADPTPSSPKPPAMTDTRTPAEMQAYQVMRYGNDGPSPPVSEAPSPFGSPVPGSRPLNVVSESERSRSRPPDARSIYAANSTHQLSPLELISALHRASAVQGRSSPSDALSASQAGVASWQPPQVQAQAKSRVESLAVAGPSGFATPDAAVTQTGNMEADPLWPDASAREQTGQHARPDAFGRGIAESSGRNYWNVSSNFSSHRGCGRATNTNPCISRSMPLSVWTAHILIYTTQATTIYSTWRKRLCKENCLVLICPTSFRCRYPPQLLVMTLRARLRSRLRTCSPRI